ncbi:MAG: LacI family DNA-binding transcriptional regulator [Lentisphaeria bacterium]|nr:LacI family DNA-binding transcriptional regulator [Lentisphaeria bacterium]
MTQSEIARKLNLTQAAVSMALNNHPAISEATRRKVLELAGKCGYRPNIAGQMLRRKRTNIIGVILPMLTNSYFAELFLLLQDHLEKAGFVLHLSQVRSKDEFISALDSLRRINIGGLITLAEYTDILTELRSSGLPIALYGASHQLEGFCQVSPDHYASGCEMTEYLISRNCRKLVFAGQRFEHEARCAGFIDACSRHNIVPAGILPLQNGEPASPEAGWRLMNEFFNSGKECDAVFAHNDELALGVIRSAKEHGIRVPEDMLVSGFDNITLSEYLSPPLTTVEQPKEVIARTLAEELIKCISDNSYANKISIACRIVKRVSA